VRQLLKILVRGDTVAAFFTSAFLRRVLHGRFAVMLQALVQKNTTFCRSGVGDTSTFPFEGVYYPGISFTLPERSACSPPRDQPNLAAYLLLF
jgi:hypothetical protein